MINIPETILNHCKAPSIAALSPIIPTTTPINLYPRLLPIEYEVMPPATVNLAARLSGSAIAIGPHIPIQCRLVANPKDKDYNTMPIKESIRYLSFGSFDFELPIQR